MLLTECQMYFRIDFNKKFINFPGGLLRYDHRMINYSKPLFNFTNDSVNSSVFLLDYVKRKT